MSGVLFVICIPRERYEKCMDNAIRSVDDDDLQSQQQNQNPGTVSSESSDTSLKTARRSLNEYIVTATTSISIESDVNNPKQQPQQDEEQFVQGSLDSEIFRRAVEKRREQREMEETAEKFFSTPTEKVLDKMLTPMEQVLREIIRKMDITNVSWKKINCANFYKISFCMEKGARFDETIHLLSEYGIGQKKGSTIAVIGCTYYDNRRTKAKDERETSEILKETSWSKFVGTVRARLNVAKIVDAVKSDASLTFDFVVLLVVASVLASFGLVENSTIFLTASMLISPLMGPILAATFGAAIRNHRLQYWGLRNEIIGVFMCIFVGFLFGLIISGVDYWFGDTKELTHEILSRCNIRSVLVGICIALPSGAAQSIALLRENFGSLVGVAISASLLPPAVNTGLLWSFSLLSQVFGDTGVFDSFIKERRYETSEAVELIILGFISLLVTLTNVFSVYVMGYIFLKLKIRVAPLLNDEEREFWRHDVPIARDFNHAPNDDDERKLRAEIGEFCENEPQNFKGVGRELLRQDFYMSNRHTWSPVSHRHRHDIASFKELEMLYRSMNKLDEEKDHHQHKGALKKKSEPIAAAKASTSHGCRHYGTIDGGAPVNRQITFVDILSSSNEDGQKQAESPRKFVVTPVDDPYV